MTPNSTPVSSRCHSLDNQEMRLHTCNGDSQPGPLVQAITVPLLEMVFSAASGHIFEQPLFDMVW